MATRKLTQDDIDAGLTQADVDLGMRGSVMRRGDKDMRARMAAEKYESPSIVDQYRNYRTHPEAKSFPVAPARELEVEEIVPLESPRRRTSNDEIGDLVERLGRGRVGTIPPRTQEPIGAKKGGHIKKMKKGGAVKSSASKRGDGIAQRGKTKGKML